MRDISKAGSGPWVRELVINTVTLMVNGIIVITSPVYSEGNFTALNRVVSGPENNIRPWRIWFNRQKVGWQTEWALESYLGQDELFGTKPVKTLRMSEANLKVGYLWERASSGGQRLTRPSRIVLQSGFHPAPSSSPRPLPCLTLPRWIYLLFFLHQ